jgi:hypothetical protein
MGGISSYLYLIPIVPVKFPKGGLGHPFNECISWEIR